MSIWVESTIKAHDFIDEKYWHENYLTVKDVYIPIANTFVYEDKEGIKGFISIINNEFIGALFVDISSQGIGIGSELIDYVINIYGNLRLAVYKDNEDACKFYKSKGFNILREEINEYTCCREYIMKN